MLRGLKKPWKQALAGLMAALMVFGIIPVAPFAGILAEAATAPTENGGTVSDGDFNGWQWNVFGGGTKNTVGDKNTISVTDNSVTLTASGDKGKIAKPNDGINFLSKKLENNTDNFILVADANLTNWKANNQVAFGLMMRPAVNLTTTTAEPESNPLRHVFVGGFLQKLSGSNRISDTATPTAVSLEGLTDTAVKTGNYKLILQRVGDNVIVSLNNYTGTATIASAEYTDMYVGMFVSRTATATYSNMYLDSVAANTAVAVDVTSMPTKKQYTCGDTRDAIDLSGFSATTSTGRTIDGSQVIVKTFDSSAEGDSNIVLNYLGTDINVPVNFIKEVVTDVTIEYAPTKTDYMIGDSIDWSGFTGKVTYNSGTVKDLLTLINAGDAETTVEGFDTTTAGTKTVTVTHTHGEVSKSASFKVNVSDKTLTGIALTGPTTTTYYKNVAITDANAYKEGLRITATYSDDSTDVISNMSAPEISITPASNVDVATTGDTEYTVNYTVGGVTKTATYTLSVVEEDATTLQIKTYPSTTTFEKGTVYSSEGIALELLKNSGNTEALLAGEYTVDSTAYNKDVEGSYEIKITETKTGKSLTTSYTVSVVGKSAYSYSDRTWKSIVFGQSIDKNNKPTVSNGEITVEQGEGSGKVTDAGQDGIAYYYTEVGKDENFELSAEVTVDYFVTKDAPDNQEGFGIMVRDALGDDGDSSIFYSNAISVGGYYGRYNVFGRYGYSDLTPDDFTNVYQYGKTNGPTSYYKLNNDVAHYKISSSKTFKMTLAKDNTGVWATMIDTDTNDDVLAPAYNKNDTGTPVYAENEAYRVYLPSDTFVSVDSNSYYVGFMAARGAKIRVATDSIKMKVTKAESDAPQVVLPADPVTPEVVITSLMTSSEADYVLKAKANAAGLLTVKVNGVIVVKQQNIEKAGTYSFPITLKEGNNPVQITFEPSGDNLTSTSTVGTNATIVYKQYGEASTELFISPTGKSTAAGTKDDPLNFETAVNFCQAGQTIYALDGTYTFNSTIEIPRGNNGTSSEMKKLYAYSSNDGVVFDFAGTASTFNVSGDYWHVKGINVTKGVGLRVGGNHNIIELCKTYNNTDTGLQISRTDSAKTIDAWPSYNTVLNCDSYNNRDSSDNNADGFAAKLTVGEGNVFQGCIAYNNVDDGWDLFAKASLIGAVKVIDCIAYGNGFCVNADGDLVATKGDGNGFKLGGSGQPVAHEIRNSIAFGNKANGFTNNSDPIFNAYDCIGYNNGGENVELHIYTNASTDKLVVDGFYSFSDDHIGDMHLLDGKKTGTDLSNSTVKGGNFKSEKNFLWNSKTKTSENSNGVPLTAGNFVSLAEYSDYMNLIRRYQRDESGNIIYGDFLKYQESQEIAKAEVSDTIPESVLTDEVKTATGCTTPEMLVAYMIEKLLSDESAKKIRSNIQTGNSIVVDAIVKVSFDGGATWVNATAGNFPEAGMDIVLPYPSGTNGSDYDFIVGHLIVLGANGKTPGTMEYFEPIKTDDGLKIHIMSASPFVIGWVEVDDDDDDDDDDDVKAGEESGIAAVIANATKNTTKPGSSPKTFDESRFVPEVSETELADFAKKLTDKQLEQEVADLLITPQAAPFPYGIVIVAIFAMVAFIGGEVIFFRRRKQK